MNNVKINREAGLLWEIKLKALNQRPSRDPQQPEATQPLELPEQRQAAQSDAETMPHKQLAQSRFVS